MRSKRDQARSLYGDFIVPEQAEMDAACLGALRSGAPGYDRLSD